MVSLHYLFQVGLEPLLLLALSLYFMALLFKYLGIVLRDIRRDRERHCSTEERGKKISFLFMYC